MSEVAIKKGFIKSKLGQIPKEWKEIKFGDVPDKKTKWSLTGGPFGSNLVAAEFTSEGVRIIQLQNMGDGKFKNKYKIYTSRAKADSLLSCNIYPGDLILAKMGDPVARACEIPESDSGYVMGSDGIRLVPDAERFNKKFVLEYINYSIFRKLAIRHSTGSTRQRIGLIDLKKLPFVLPPLNEQKKIAQILTTWDTAIEKTEQLLQQLQLRKQGLMQQLLSGKKRLKGFVGEWEMKKLGDIGKVKMCKRIFSYQTETKGDIPFFKIGTFGKTPDAYISNELFTEFKSKYSYPKKGDILLSASGSIGRTVVFDGKFSYFQDSNIVWIDNNELLVLNKYLLYVFKIVRYQSEGGTIKRLYNSIISNTKFMCPPLSEQRKITKILTQSDLEIQKTKTYLTQMQVQKKGLMQQLLTGQKRVKI